MSLIKTNKPGLMRDATTQAVINTDMSEYEQILEKRKQNKQIQTVQQQIDSLKNEFSDLKNLIFQLINGNK
jgi:conjugal transfer/entry exclusion protein